MTRIILGVDGGSSKTTARLEVLGSGRQFTATVEGGTNLYAGDPQSVHRVLKAALGRVLNLADLAPEEVQLSSAVIGTAGIAIDCDDARHLGVFRPAIMEIGLTRGNPPILVVSDVDTVLACGEADRRVAVIAGTGSNVCAVRFADGDEVQREYFGGMGLDLSDEGSAAWIGHMACREALLSARGITAPALGRAVYEHFNIQLYGPDDWRLLLPVRQEISKSELAALAAAVVLPLAEREDTVAFRIVSQGAKELATLTVATLRNLGLGNPEYYQGPVDLVLVGGMWRSEMFSDMFEEHVLIALFDQEHRPDNLTITCGADPTLGALALARRLIA